MADAERQRQFAEKHITSANTGYKSLDSKAGHLTEAGLFPSLLTSLPTV
jgi:hypothetical protein